MQSESRKSCMTFGVTLTFLHALSRLMGLTVRPHAHIVQDAQADLDVPTYLRKRVAISGLDSGDRN